MGGEKKGMKALEIWCRQITYGYKDVQISNMTTSFRDGLAFCALIHHFRPDLLDFEPLSKDNIYHNNDLAFSIAEQKLGIPALLDAEDMVQCEVPDRLSILTYVSQFYNYFEGIPAKSPMKRAFQERTSEQILVGPPNKLFGGSKSVPTSMNLGKRQESCASCNNKVYILERLIIENKLYHRTCFRCTKCKTLLKPGAYVEAENENTYECVICPHEEKGGFDFSCDLSEVKEPESKTEFKTDDLKAHSNASSAMKAYLRKISESTDVDCDEKDALGVESNVDYEKEADDVLESLASSSDDDSSSESSEDEKMEVKKKPELPKKPEHLIRSKSSENEAENIDIEDKQDTPKILEKNTQESEDDIIDNYITTQDSDEVLDDQETIEIKGEIKCDDEEIRLNTHIERLDEDGGKVPENDVANPFDDDDEKEVICKESEEPIEDDETKCDDGEIQLNSLGEDSGQKYDDSSGKVPENDVSEDVANPFEDDDDDEQAEVCKEHEKAAEDPLPERPIEASEPEKFIENSEPEKCAEDLEPEKPAEEKDPNDPIEESYYPVSNNPFGDDDDDDDKVEQKEYAKEESKQKESSNPFGDTDDEEDLNPFANEDDIPDNDTQNVDNDWIKSIFGPKDTKKSPQNTPERPVPKPRGRLSVPSPDGTLSGRKKRRAPLPPSGSVSVENSPKPSPRLLKCSPAPSPPPRPSRPSRARDNVAIKNISAEQIELVKHKTSTLPHSPQKLTYGYWKKKKKAPPIPIPIKRHITKIPLDQVQVELKNIEAEQLELEESGVKIEKKIRDMSEEDISAEEEDLVMQLFGLVDKKNALFRRQAELMYLKRQHRLEEEHTELEYQIRLMMQRADHLKTDSDKAKEEEMIAHLIDVVRMRNEIIENQERDRLRIKAEEEGIDEEMNAQKAEDSEKVTVEDKKKAKKLKKKLKKEKKDKEKVNKEHKTRTLLRLKK